MLHWALFWGGSRSTKPCIFPCKVAAGGDERYLLCAAGAAGVVLVPPLCSATSGCSCARSSLRFLHLRFWIALERRHDCCHLALPWRREMQVSHVMLQNAVSWLHECCMGFVLGRKPEHGTLYFSVYSGCRRR